MDSPTGFILTLFKQHIECIRRGNYGKFQLHYIIDTKYTKDRYAHKKINLNSDKHD